MQRQESHPWQKINQEKSTSQGDFTFTITEFKSVGKGQWGEVRKIRVKLEDGTEDTWIEKIVDQQSPFQNEAMLLERAGLLITSITDDNKIRYFMRDLGKDLQKRIDQEAKTRLSDSNEILFVCQGFLHSLALLHKKGIVHGDIQLANIGYKKRTGQINLLDFNLAFLKDDGKKHVSGCVGTLAPEVKKQGQSCQSDVYSAAQVLIILLMVNDNYSSGSQQLQLISKKQACENLHNHYNLKSDQANTLYELLEKMLDVDPKARPNMEEVVDIFDKTLFAHHFISKAPELNILQSQMADLKATIKKIIFLLETKQKQLKNKDCEKLEKIQDALGSKERSVTMHRAEDFYGLLCKIETFEQQKISDKLVVYRFRNEIILTLNFLKHKKLSAFKGDYSMFSFPRIADLLKTAAQKIKAISYSEANCLSTMGTFKAVRKTIETSQKRLLSPF